MEAARRVEAIRQRLNAALDPETLVVEDEGHLHVGHEGAKDGRGHFRVLIVAKAFEGQSMLQRHRTIYSALGDLLESDIHALAIEAYTDKEL